MDARRPSKSPAPAAPSSGMFLRAARTRWVRVTILAVAAVVAGAGAVAVLALVFWASLDGGTAREGDVLALRPACGIGGGAFASPASAAGSGFQEHTYTYRYVDRPASWVDRHVLARFGAAASVEELSPVTEVPVRRSEDMEFGGPSLTDEDGGALVWSSPFGRSEMGSTTFDAYRRTDGGYDVVVECANSAGINASRSAAAVPTSAP